MSKTIKSAGSAALAFCLTFGVIGLLAEQPAAASPRDHADPNRVEVSERVSTAGLDLAKPADLRRLETRIRSASRRLCDDQARPRFSPDDLRCMAAARDSAERQLAGLIERSQRLAAGQSIEIRTRVALTALGDE